MNPHPILTGLLLCAAASFPAAGDLILTREVVADVFARPSKSGSGPACPERIEPPQTGDTVRLSVAPGAARRDEPQVSFVVRLDAGEAYILHHASGTYSELPYPPKPRQLESRFRKDMKEAAEEVFPYRVLQAVGRSPTRQHEVDAIMRVSTVESAMLGRRDIESIELPGDAALVSAAHAVEAFTQAVRDHGEDWLSLLGDPEGIPLGLQESRHQPATVIRYREAFSKLDDVDLEASTFLPPEGYKKVKHEPYCF